MQRRRRRVEWTLIRHDNRSQIQAELSRPVGACSAALFWCGRPRHLKRPVFVARQLIDGGVNRMEGAVGNIVLSSRTTRTSLPSAVDRSATLLRIDIAYPSNRDQSTVRSRRRGVGPMSLVAQVFVFHVMNRVRWCIALSSQSGYSHGSLLLGS
jgi:hypothetical protein